MQGNFEDGIPKAYLYANEYNPVDSDEILSHLSLSVCFFIQIISIAIRLCEEDTLYLLPCLTNEYSLFL